MARPFPLLQLHNTYSLHVSLCNSGRIGSDDSMSYGGRPGYHTGATVPVKDRRNDYQTEKTNS